MPKGGRPSASLTSGSCSQASFFRDSGDRKGASLSGTRRSGAVPFSFLSKFCRSRASADARSPQGIIRSTMSVKSREKIALAVFAALIVLSLLGLGWYLVAGHSWNVAASNIDDTFGSMDGYTAIVYEGTAVPQTAAEKAAEAAKEEKAAKGAAGSASSCRRSSPDLRSAPASCRQVHHNRFSVCRSCCGLSRALWTPCRAVPLWMLRSPCSYGRSHDPVCRTGCHRGNHCRHGLRFCLPDHRLRQVFLRRTVFLRHYCRRGCRIHSVPVFCRGLPAGDDPRS